MPLPPALLARFAPELAETGARVRVGYPLWLRPFLLRGVVALTLGRRIFLSRELLAGREERVEAVLRHELVHVRQARRLGAVRFVAAYFGEYVALRRRGLPHVEAYRAISFEREAAAAERPPA